eukprot:7990315-Alexandrium_andersonii.AAC.1
MGARSRAAAFRAKAAQHGLKRRGACKGWAMLVATRALFAQDLLPCGWNPLHCTGHPAQACQHVIGSVGKGWR